MVSAKKTTNRNLEFNIKKRELKLHKGYSKLDFIISAYAKNCGYKNIKSKYKCDLFKPLISNNLIKTVDVTGREINPATKEKISFQIYEDGTVKKQYLVK